MSETILVMAGTGERIRVEKPYDDCKQLWAMGGIAECKTLGSFPGDPVVAIRMIQVAMLFPAVRSW